MKPDRQTLYLSPAAQLRLEWVRSQYRDAGCWTTVSAIANRALALLESHLAAHPLDDKELAELARHGHASRAPFGRHH